MVWVPLPVSRTGRFIPILLTTTTHIPFLVLIDHEPCQTKISLLFGSSVKAVQYKTTHLQDNTLGLSSGSSFHWISKIYDMPYSRHLCTTTLTIDTSIKEEHKSTDVSGDNTIDSPNLSTTTCASLPQPVPPSYPPTLSEHCGHIVPISHLGEDLTNH